MSRETDVVINDKSKVNAAMFNDHFYTYKFTAGSIGEKLKISQHWRVTKNN